LARNARLRFLLSRREARATQPRGTHGESHWHDPALCCRSGDLLRISPVDSDHLGPAAAFSRAPIIAVLYSDRNLLRPSLVNLCGFGKNSARRVRL